MSQRIKLSMHMHKEQSLNPSIHVKCTHSFSMLMTKRELQTRGCPEAQRLITVTQRACLKWQGRRGRRIPKLILQCPQSYQCLCLYWHTRVGTYIHVTPTYFIQIHNIKIINYKTKARPNHSMGNTKSCIAISGIWGSWYNHLGSKALG